jgi:hypothetical protein
MDLLLGIEPIVALSVGVAAMAIAPVIGALGNTEAGQKVADTGRDMTKNGLKWGLEAFDKIQSNLAEAGESWNDLMAEAQSEVKTAKKAQATSKIKEVVITE